jgi:hypothetical protein
MKANRLFGRVIAVVILAVVPIACNAPQGPQPPSGSAAREALAPAAAPGGGAACTPPQSRTLNVPLLPQNTDMWCWAASAQMIMRSFNSDVAQCRQADDQFGPIPVSCCATPTADACIRGGWPQFENYGFGASKTLNRALTWKELTQQIGCKGTPVAFTWFNDGGSGHMMVASGYEIRNGEQWVIVRDPFPANVGGDITQVAYEFFVEGPGYSHWNDYFDVHPMQISPSAPPTTGGGS